MPEKYHWKMLTLVGKSLVGAFDPERPFIRLTLIFNTGDHLDSATAFIVDLKSISPKAPTFGEYSLEALCRSYQGTVLAIRMLRRPDKHPV